VIENLEKEQKQDLFLLGAEESYGYLIGTHAKDKDAIISACALCLAADLAKKENKTLIDVLNTIYETYGLSCEENYTLEFKEGTSQEVISHKMSQICDKMPQKLFNEEVLFVLDYQKQIKTNVKTKQTEILNLPKSNALGFLTENGWMIIRPSGTEPKIKFYSGFKCKISGNLEEDKKALKKLLLEEMNKF